VPLTPADVRNKQFSTTRLRPGYDEGEVDDFLEKIEDALEVLIRDNADLQACLAQILRGSVGPVHPYPPPPRHLTPADVRKQQFAATRLRPGYNEQEVDVFLDEAETELSRLIQENDQLRARLTQAAR
jgi:DivIVA domain-containing protein